MTRYKEIKKRMRELQSQLDKLRAREKELSKEFEALAREKWAIEEKGIEVKVIPLKRRATTTNKKKSKISAELAALVVQLDRGQLSKEEAKRKVADLLSAA